MLPIRIAILDDYQGVALASADWTAVQARAEIVVYRDHVSDQDALAERLRSFEIICVMRERTPLSGALLARLPALRLLVSTGHRNPSIDLETAERLGVALRYTGSTTHAAMELTWALILGAMRHLPAEVAQMRAGGWQTTVGVDLKGATLGLIGLGKIGSAMARVAKAFEMNVIAWSQNLDPAVAAAADVTAVSKDELFQRADIVSLHLVLSERSRRIVGARELTLMKRSAWIVNTARGPLIEEAALIQALRERRIAGAAVDVYDIEPLPADHPMRTLANVLATPHLGFVTQDTYRIFFAGTVRAIADWLAQRRSATA